jgi:hypothetical protein
MKFCVHTCQNCQNWRKIVQSGQPAANPFLDECLSGLPDGLFSNQKSQFWSNLEGLGMENVVTFYDHL